MEAGSNAQEHAEDAAEDNGIYLAFIHNKCARAEDAFGM
jgi:hypothetical protein